jgi:GNAT superfamily N-acetyltransferase
VALEKASPDRCYLERLAVLSHERRRGLGHALVDHAFHQARDMGVKKIGIGIIAKQTDLKKWYERIGFVEGETKRFDHLPFLVTFMSYLL